MGREFLVRPEDVEVRTNATGERIRVLLGQHGEGHFARISDLPPFAEIPAHFHDVDQFQIVLAGGGTYGGDPVVPGTIHYVDRGTPYGPLVAGPDGMRFMVLRPNTDRPASITFVSDIVQHAPT